MPIAPSAGGGGGGGSKPKSSNPAKNNPKQAAGDSAAAQTDALRKIKASQAKKGNPPVVTSVPKNSGVTPGSQINTSGNKNIGAGATPDQVNPPFASQITTIGSNNSAWGFKNPQRGFFWVPATYGKQKTTGSGGNAKTTATVTSGQNTGLSGKIKFLWNPPELVIDFPQNPLVPAANARVPSLDLTTQSLIAPYGTLSVPLYFDRTIDVMTGNVPNGVWADILAFYDLTGISLGVKGSAKTNGGLTATTFIGYSYAESPMGWVEGWLYLGNQTQYYGVLTDLNVDVTQWNADMVPVRATITISMTLLTPPKNTPGKSTSQTLVTYSPGTPAAAAATAKNNKGTYTTKAQPTAASIEGAARKKEFGG